MSCVVPFITGKISMKIRIEGAVDNISGPIDIKRCSHVEYVLEKLRLYNRHGEPQTWRPNAVLQESIWPLGLFSGHAVSSATTITRPLLHLGFVFWYLEVNYCLCKLVSPAQALLQATERERGNWNMQVGGSGWTQQPSHAFVKRANVSLDFACSVPTPPIIFNCEALISEWCPFYYGTWWSLKSVCMGKWNSNL